MPSNADTPTASQPAARKRGAPRGNTNRRTHGQYRRPANCSPLTTSSLMHSAGRLNCQTTSTPTPAIWPVMTWSNCSHSTARMPAAWGAC